MISRVSGRLAELRGQSATLEVGDIAYELLVATATAAELAPLLGERVTFFTVQYLEGSLAGSNLLPRLIGFLRPADREFFHALTQVKGISMRRALRAMAVPVSQIATAIERGDERTLTSLPDIGKKTAAQVINDLRGKVAEWTHDGGAIPGIVEMNEPQKLALEILVQWGDRRHDAQRWIAAAVQRDPALSDPQQIVRAAYKVKQSA